MITREYHAYVTVYKEGEEGKHFSEHSFSMVIGGWRRPGVSELMEGAQDFAISQSVYQDSVGGVIVKSLTRVK